MDDWGMVKALERIADSLEKLVKVEQDCLTLSRQIFEQQRKERYGNRRETNEDKETKTE